MSAREAYIAGLSGSKEYKVTKDTSPKDAQRQVAAFTAGSNTVQRDTPDIFKDQINLAGPPEDDGSFTLQVDKNPLNERLKDLKNQDEAFQFINDLNRATPAGVLDREVLNFIKTPLTGIGAFTTDPNEGRNVYQLLLNKMFQGDREQMRGAQPLFQGDVAGMRRLGRTLFRDPNVDVSFAENLKSLLPFVTNPGVVNVRDFPGGGITNLPEFGQAGLDFTKEQGFRDYGAALENLAKLAVPAPLRAVLGQAGDMGDDLFLTPIKNLFNLGEEEVIQEEPEEKKKKEFFFF
jgi:hypothetical protein